MRLLSPIRWRRVLAESALILLGLLALAQLVPYGRDHTNPPATREPAWDSAETRALAERACFDCHSNLTDWPWYSHVAPASWVVQSDVDSGRDRFDFSEWNRPQQIDAERMAQAIRGGSMPPWFYAIAHPDSRLDSNEQDALVRGLRATLAASPPGT